MNILVVDDCKSICEALEIKLEKEKHNVKIAYTGYDFLTIFNNNNNSQVVIIDIFLPDTSGIIINEKIKKINKDIVSIGITGLKEKDESIYKEYGFDYIIEKPFPLSELINIINKIKDSK